jgi:hypothetical protein
VPLPKVRHILLDSQCQAVGPWSPDAGDWVISRALGEIYETEQPEVSAPRAPQVGRAVPAQELCRRNAFREKCAVWNIPQQHRYVDSPGCYNKNIG